MPEPTPELKPTERPLPKANYRSYVDPTHEFDAKTFERGLWFVRHKVFLYRLLLVSLIVVAGVLWAYVLFVAARYVVFGYAVDAQLAADATSFINYSPLKQVYAPAPVQVGGVSLLPSGTTKADAVAEVTNPNARWLATFKYHFDLGTASTTSQVGVILPGQTTLLSELGVLADVSTPSIAIDDMQWRKISNHDVTDVPAFVLDHTNFVVSNYSFTPAGSDSTTAAAGRIAFTFTNQTAYSYRVPQFLIGLYRSQALVAVLPLQFDSFVAGEAKPVDVRVFVPNIQIDSIQVFPLINIFDPANFLPPAS